MIQLKRVYEKPSRKVGLRILIDRLWPRGQTEERAAVKLWPVSPGRISPAGQFPRSSPFISFPADRVTRHRRRLKPFPADASSGAYDPDVNKALFSSWHRS